MKSLKQLLLIAATELLSEGEYNCGICHTCGEIQECIEPDACEEQCECCKKFDVFGVSETLLMLAE